MIKPSLTLCLRKLLFPFGAYATGHTSPDTLRAFMARLHPKVADKELVRFEPSTDGGCLLSDELDGISTCFSPEVSLLRALRKGVLIEE